MIRKFRHVNQQPSFLGNGEEGSETRDKATGSSSYAGNVLPMFGNSMGTPGILWDDDIVRTTVIVQEPLTVAEMTTAVCRMADWQQNSGRKAFYVEQLPDGALPLYDRDPAVPAYIIGEEGENVVVVTKSKRFLIPLFEIACNPEIPLTQVKERRFDLGGVAA